MVGAPVTIMGPPPIPMPGNFAPATPSPLATSMPFVPPTYAQRDAIDPSLQ